MPPSDLSALSKVEASPGVSVAPLDRDSLLAVLKTVIASDQTLQELSVSIDDAGAVAEYVLGSSQKLASTDEGVLLDDYYIIKIHVCAPRLPATFVMKAHADSFEASPPQPAKGLVKPLGDATPLATPSSIFWTRGDSVFVDITHGVAAGSTKSPPVSATLLVPLAGALDAHLAANWAADVSKVAPQAVLATPTPVKVPAGGVFTVQLRLGNAAATHRVMRADGTVAVQTENGSKDGLFTFLATRQGSGRVRMRVADAKTLAVTVVEAAVEVGPPAKEVESDGEDDEED